MEWEFHKAPGGDFACDFAAGLADALVVVAPEFEVGNIDLGEAIQVACDAASGD